VTLAGLKSCWVLRFNIARQGIAGLHSLSPHNFAWKSRELLSQNLRILTPQSLWCICFLSRLKADSHTACRAHAAPMPLPCLSPAMPFFNSHMPWRAPALLRQCHIIRESPCGSRKYPNCLHNSLTDRLFCSVLLPLFTVVDMDRCEEDWYAFYNNLRGTSRGSRKKPKAGR